MPKTYIKRAKTWTDADITKALEEVKSGKTVNSTALKYGMDEGTLRYRLKKIGTGEEVSVSGRKPVFDSNTEEQLAKCIGTLCKVGFSPTKGEILDLVAQYVKENKINVKQFANGRPGKDWFKAFMNRNNLSLKKANMISVARKSATGNPFVINDFYDILENAFEKNNY